MPPVECKISTLTLWVLHGKIETKSRWCSRLGGAVPPTSELTPRARPLATSRSFSEPFPLNSAICLQLVAVSVLPETVTCWRRPTLLGCSGLSQPTDTGRRRSGAQRCRAGTCQLLQAVTSVAGLAVEQCGSHLRGLRANR